MTEASPNPEALAGMARKALAEGSEDVAAPMLDAAARRAKNNPHLWQWAGLLYRALGEHEYALDAFSTAARLAPDDRLIAHGYARVALEAGVDARDLFDVALRLDPSGDVFLGRAAARFAMGQGREAFDELESLIERNLRWAAGHIQWAQLAAMTGQADRATELIDQALVIHPQDTALWQAALHILTAGERHDEAWHRADDAVAATGMEGPFALARAAALSDAGEWKRAALAFDGIGVPSGIDHAVHLARHHVRTGNLAALNLLTDRWMGGETARFFWPYASITWRQANDPRWRWLEGDDHLIFVTDLTAKLPCLDALSEKLRVLHAGSGRFLDQSVRGGTQTDGALFSRIDPEIRALRSAVVEAVEVYRDQLPAVDPGHPMLRHGRDVRIGFSGSWSVRLASAGYHSNHVHPQGWISSAFYVALPTGLEGEEGWLTLGQPQAELRSGLEPFRKIAPKVGQLVLFPSMMWHGTLPFATGERLTVAFDVAPPR